MMANGSNLQHTFLIHPLIGVLNFQYFLASFFTKKNSHLEKYIAIHERHE